MEKFASEMDTLLEITLRSNLVEKLSMALYDCLFEHDADEELEIESKVQTSIPLNLSQSLFYFIFYFRVMALVLYQNMIILQFRQFMHSYKIFISMQHKILKNIVVICLWKLY